MISTISNLISDAWDNTIIRLSIILACVGFMPFYLLCMAKAALVG